MNPTNQDVEIYAETNITTADGGRRLVANCGGYQSNRRGENAYEENVANAKLIAALWNMVRALNPADPLAVASALPDVVAALNEAAKIVTKHVDKHPEASDGQQWHCYDCAVHWQVNVALAALKGGVQ